MNTKTYIKTLVKECVEQKRENNLKESIKPIVAKALMESFMESEKSDSSNSGKINVKSLVKKLMKNPNFKKAAQNYLSKSEKNKEYDGFAKGDKTYTSLDNLSDGSKRRIVTQRLTDKKMDWAPMAYELWPDMTEDAARSWFSKKVGGKGGEEFSDEEISTLYNLLNNKLTESMRNH